jgi:TatD DNase family protein
MIVDSHCHLAGAEFVLDLDAVVARAHAAGVTRALCILAADNADELARVPAVQAAWPGILFAAAIHPHRAGEYRGRVSEAAAATRAAVLVSDASVLAEIGLDYHYDFAPRDVQREVFAAQVDVAVALDRPVAIHTREATDDTIAVLREAGQGQVRGIMHCFSGTIDEARQALDLGFLISLSGIVTFPKAGALRELAGFVPEDRLLVETDAPYLAPVPHRGKRNEPAWVAETLAVLARARATTTDALGAIVTRNFDRLLGATK